MRNLETKIEARVSQDLSETTSVLQQRLDLLSEELSAMQSRTISIGTDLRLSAVEKQVKAMSPQVRQLRGRADQGLLAWLWLAGWVVAGTIAAAWWRSHRPRTTPPADPLHAGLVIDSLAEVPRRANAVRVRE